MMAGKLRMLVVGQDILRTNVEVGNYISDGLLLNSRINYNIRHKLG